ncbi:alkaline phosphatase [Pseudaeromonas sp. ZJS20]|uniref:alkaline phosphatase n=1 Tax=Pseudaeromonas aegiceratis TaxID=3153928 RepID=UPI00390CD813
MKRLAPLALLCGGLLLAGCNSDDDSARSSSPGLPTAKHVLFFLGDGMGITTLTAARIYAVGEDGNLTIDTLPETAFLKTYSHDSQVTDSAPSMAAYMTGVKSNNGVISMDANATQEADCADSAGSAVTTLLELAKAKGMGTGVVTSTRVTHATPAATYSHICNRDLEYDIAAQLVPGTDSFNSALGDGVDLILGGGSKYFLPKSAGGGRSDERNLVSELQALDYQYASNLNELVAADTSKRLLGLFNSSHLAYDLDRLNGDAPTEPSLAEMTAKAIDMLGSKEEGFFLMVEGGRIDHALHDTNAKRALQDTVAFDNAIKTALDKMKVIDPDLSETLIVVTADHDHTLVLNGYAQRTGKTTASQAGVLGVVKNYGGSSAGEPATDADGAPYTIIGFGNGSNRIDGPREALDDDTTSADDYRQEVVFKTGTPGSESHGGTDVFLGAIGQGADSFHGVMENTAVFDKIKAAAAL